MRATEPNAASTTVIGIPLEAPEIHLPILDSAGTMPVVAPNGSM
jgi:hypothetical protein